MEVDIIQNNSKPTALVASFAPYTLDRNSVHQESQSRQGLMLSALTTPHECSTTYEGIARLRPGLFFNLDADELQIVRRNESAVTPSELSALAKWKKAKKNQWPRNTRLAGTIRFRAQKGFADWAPEPRLPPAVAVDVEKQPKRAAFPASSPVLDRAISNSRPLLSRPTPGTLWTPRCPLGRKPPPLLPYRGPSVRLSTRDVARPTGSALVETLALTTKTRSGPP
ncbi:hypothetical protein THAOC_15497 [Thalassiosira oceanica]|uniref:Uncharacterized protein n=1 Tax=Thalassiosira oceanica TaxID=159749 RepID=K0SRZ9_THAOC|nr:hypothetical protein THAOC_15497 [Thalassiosira oceanica]|eukprot:EJK63826.1 hypothetical protein THAOC_15497 [Thalassiosira oceanica]